MQDVVFRFNTCEAMWRAFDQVTKDYGSKPIRGQILGYTFTTWERFKEILKFLAEHPVVDTIEAADAFYGEIIVTVR